MEICFYLFNLLFLNFGTLLHVSHVFDFLCLLFKNSLLISSTNSQMGITIRAGFTKLFTGRTQPVSLISTHVITTNSNALYMGSCTMAGLGIV